jgi:ubiquitin-protein ligase
MLTSLKNECDGYIKLADKVAKKNPKKENEDMEYNLISNFIIFVRRLERLVIAYNISEKIKTNEISKQFEMKKTVKQLYKMEMKEEISKENENMNLAPFDSFEKNDKKNTTGSFINPGAMKFLMGEINKLKEILPQEFESTILHRYYSDNLNYHEFIIIGSEGTPYDSGCFLFRFYCGQNYPVTNPQVKIITTGKGQVSFNPNLFSSGLVCLSILGTVSAPDAERWIPFSSTMYQIVNAIQGVVMNATPYFNSGGNEKYIGTIEGDRKSFEYNQTIRLGCMIWAMTDMIKNPPQGFESAIHTHFRIKTDYIKKLCKQWCDTSTNEHKTKFNTAYNELVTALDSLHKKNAKSVKK